VSGKGDINGALHNWRLNVGLYSVYTDWSFGNFWQPYPSHFALPNEVFSGTCARLEKTKWWGTQIE